MPQNRIIKCFTRCASVALATSALFVPLELRAQPSSVSDDCLNVSNPPCIVPIRPDRFKSLILEFVDVEQSTIGHTLSRLVWREVRELTTDIRGTVVVLTHNQSNFGTVRTRNPLLNAELDGTYPAEFITSEMLRSKGHVAANLIGQQSTADIVVWGSALSVGEAVLVQPNLTLPSTSSNRVWTSIKFQGDEFTIELPLPAERLNFPESSVLRTELFERSFIVRCNRASNCPDGIELKAAPSITSKVISRIDRGVQVSVSDAVNQWLLVETDEISGYLNIYHVELTPANLVFFEADVTGYSAPNADSEILFSDTISGIFPVNQISKDDGDPDNEHIVNNWYEISVSDNLFWVQGSRDSYGPAMPASLFIAALYRFQDGQYLESADLIQRYLLSESSTDPKVLASAHRFASLSNYLGRKQGSAPESVYIETALGHANQSLELLPFDPAGHALMGVILTSEGRFEDGVEAVTYALELNEFDPYIIEFINVYCSTILGMGFAPALCT